MASEQNVNPSGTGQGYGQNDDDVPQLSCDEVAELILLNKPIPGVKTIPDKPLGLGPEHSSESHSSIRLKPWETKDRSLR